MMRRLLAIMGLVLPIAIVVPAAASTRLQTSAQEQQLVLAKKRIAALQADARKRQELAASARARADQRSHFTRRECGGFFECLFGGSRRNNSNQWGRSPGRDFATAEVIS